MIVRGKNLYLKKNNKKKKIIISSIIVAILVIVVSSYSYALWSATEQQEGFNQVNISCLDLVVNDNKPINLVNAYQLSDSEALEQVPYTFKITNNCNSDEYVSIQLDMKSSNTLSTNNLRLSLISDNDYIVWPSTISELSDSSEINIDRYNTAKKLEIEKIDGNTTKEYNLYLWIDEDTPYEDINNKVFESKIEIVNTEAPENTNPTKWHITYDLDGGTISKINRTEYDENDIDFTLNTPTREGYTFAGWSGGKNLFDEETILMAIDGAKKENDYYIFHPYYAHVMTFENGIPNLSIRANSKYAISALGHTDYQEEYGTYQQFDINQYYYDGTSSLIRISGSNDIKQIDISDINKDIIKIYFSYGRGTYVNSKVYLKYLQIEEGTEVTDYEPYINNQTTVTIPKGSTGNRTYTANWIAN
ncbi:MAG: InlB B-repeat-containing protein [Bacilli bacterium]|nr:InlB B-repeat-containing protein [Bacilli bacterium]